MNLTDLAEPTTVIGLAALAIISVVYVSNTMSTKFTKHLEEKDKNYQDFVLERNHQTGDVIVKNTEILVGVGESIKSYTKSNEDLTQSVKELVRVHLTK